MDKLRNTLILFSLIYILFWLKIGLKLVRLCSDKGTRGKNATTSQ